MLALTCLLLAPLGRYPYPACNAAPISPGKLNHIPLMIIALAVGLILGRHLAELML